MIVASKCSVCGEKYSAEDFDALPLPRKCKSAAEADTFHEAGKNPHLDPAYKLRFRDCHGTRPDGKPCHNTLTRVAEIYRVSMGAWCLPPDGWTP